jgi:hypothetical protein
MSPIELWLPLGAAAFYLYDSALLLWQNELVYTRRGKGWLVDGGTEFRLGGRRVFLPQPLLPHRAHFLVCWSAADRRPVTDEGREPVALLRALRPIGAINVAQLALLCLLPVLMWITGPGLLVLLLFALFYLLAITALAVAFIGRSALGLSTRAFWLQALDVLACAPFSINLTRRLALAHGLHDEPLLFAMRHFGEHGVTQMRQLVASRVNEELEGGASAPRELQLRAVLERLES